MRVLVTGAYGYLGSALCARLRELGHDVSTLGRGDSLPDTPLDAVAHLAGGYHAFSDDNFLVSRLVSGLVDAYPHARHVLASTNQITKGTEYARSKREAEAVVVSSGGVAVRLPHVYGVSPTPRHPDRLGLTEKLALERAGGPAVEIHGDGSQLIELVPISRAIGALVDALTAYPPGIYAPPSRTHEVRDVVELFRGRPSSASTDVDLVLAVEELCGCNRLHPHVAARPRVPVTGSLLFDIRRVLESGRLILGPETEALEREYAAYVGTRHAVAVASCTAALQGALTALTRRDSSTALVPTNTFAATAAAALHAGLEVGLYDVDELSRLVPRDGPSSQRPDVVVVTHVAGIIDPEVPALVERAHARGVLVVEDCAHAHGAILDGRQAGSLGDVGCHSFYATKVLTGLGTGGMVTTDRDDVAEVVRSLRHHGEGPGGLTDVCRVGHDWLMPEVAAVVLRHQIRRLPEILAHRRLLAHTYDDALHIHCDLRECLPAFATGCKPSWYKYPVTVPKGVDGRRVRARLAEHGVETGGVYDPPLHRQPAFEALAGARGFPVADSLLPRQVCLPMHEGVDPVRDAPAIVETFAAAVHEQLR